MNYKGIIYLLAALFFSACAENGRLLDEQETFAVQFSAVGISAEVTTRAFLANKVTLRILAFRRKSTTPDLSADEYMGEGTYKIGDNGTMPALSPLLLRAGIYDFYALTPDLTVTRSNNAGDGLTCTVSVGHGSDYATSLTEQQAVSEMSPTVLLKELNRHCSKLLIALSPKASNITSVELVSAALTNMTKSPVSVSLCSSISLAGIEKNEEVTLAGNDFSTPDAGNNTSASTVILPREAGAFQFKMKAAFNGNAAKVFVADMPSSLVFAPNTQYALNMKMKGDSIQLSMLVAPWNDETIPGQNDLGVSTPIEFIIGNWKNVDYDAVTGGGNTTVEAGSWQVNPDLEAVLGEYTGLTTGKFPWTDQKVTANTGGGNTGLDAGPWGEDVNYGDDANGTGNTGGGNTGLDAGPWGEDVNYGDDANGTGNTGGENTGLEADPWGRDVIYGDDAEGTGVFAVDEKGGDTK